MAKNTKLRILSAAFAVSSVFIGANSASAAPPPLSLTTGDTITLGYGGTAQGDTYGGGEFQATGVSVANGSSGSFMTFCLEYTEEFNPGGTYYVKVNTGAVNGGYSSAGTYAGDVNGTSTYDPVSNATAWLYTQYRGGTLSGFTETTAKDTSLQLAIWNLEGELAANASALAAYGTDSLAQGWVNSAVAAAQAGYTNSNVEVLNLYDTRTGTAGNYQFQGNHQDQLYLAPVPEPETYAMMLAGLGLMGFVARRRGNSA